MYKIPTIRAIMVSFCLVASVGLSTAQQTINFTVSQSPLPVSDFAITYKPDRVSYIFIDSSVAQNATINEWFWDFGDGNTSNAQFTSHTYSQMGVYNVCLAIRTDKNCRDTTCQFADSWLGLSDQGRIKNSLLVAPNPFTDELTIQFEVFTRGDISVEVYSLLGEKVQVLMSGIQEPGVKKLTFDASDDIGSSGVYFIKIRSEEVVLTEKVVRTL
ncbi:MAG: PKD domain-containing protein [Vicingaceae bacterium]